MRTNLKLLVVLLALAVAMVGAVIGLGYGLHYAETFTEAVILTFAFTIIGVFCGYHINALIAKADEPWVETQRSSSLE